MGQDMATGSLGNFGKLHNALATSRTNVILLTTTVAGKEKPDESPTRCTTSRPRAGTDPHSDEGV